MIIPKEDRSKYDIRTHWFASRTLNGDFENLDATKKPEWVINNEVRHLDQSWQKHWSETENHSMDSAVL